jgi:hypothetical protein
VTDLEKPGHAGDEEQRAEGEQRAVLAQEVAALLPGRLAAHAGRPALGLERHRLGLAAVGDERRQRAGGVEDGQVVVLAEQVALGVAEIGEVADGRRVREVGLIVQAAESSESEYSET